MSAPDSSIFEGLRPAPNPAAPKVAGVAAAQRWLMEIHPPPAKDASPASSIRKPKSPPPLVAGHADETDRSPLGKFLDHLEKTNWGWFQEDSGHLITFCPLHEVDHDKHNPSLAIGEKPDGTVVAYCRSRPECRGREKQKAIFAALNYPMRELFPQRNGGKKKADSSVPGTHRLLTHTPRREPERPTMRLADFAEYTRLPEKHLTKYGVRHAVSADQKGIRIIYLDIDGQPISWKQRLHIKPPQGSPRFKTKPGAPLMAFNLPAIKFAKEHRLVICEGESDTLVAEFHGLRAIGIPGNQAEKVFPLEDIKRFGVKRLLLIPDNDAAGVQLRDSLLLLLRKGGYEGKVEIATLPPQFKDLREMHVAFGDDRKGFRVALRKSIKAVNLADLPEAPEEELNFEKLDPVERINRSFALLRSTGEVLALDPRFCSDGQDFRRYRMVDFKNVVGNWGVKDEEDGKFTPAAKAWLMSPKRRDIRDLTFAPGKPQMIETPHGVDLNLFAGFTAEAKKGDVTLWLTLLGHITKSLNREQRRYFTAWLAHRIKHPGVRPLTALVIFSIMEGNGKSLVGATIGRVLGKAFRELTDAQLENSFTDWGTGKILCLVNETEPSKYDRRKMMSRLKNLITNEFSNINAKHLQPIDVPNLIAYILTSNQPDCVVIGRRDRRFFVVRAPEEALEKSFYRKYIIWLRTDEAASALRWWAEHFDLKGYDPGADAPRTEAKGAMEEASAEDIDLWALDLSKGRLRTQINKPIPDLVTTAFLRDRMWPTSAGFPPKLSAIATALDKVGIPSVKTAQHRLRCIRNVDTWKQATNAKRNRYFEVMSGMRKARPGEKF